MLIRRCFGNLEIHRVIAITPMTSGENKITQLAAFKQRDNFSNQAWHQRGLHPSDSKLYTKLTTLFNHCVDALIEAIHNNSSDKQLKTTLALHLASFKKRDYDTEEKEIIGELFLELAQMLDIDFGDNISHWHHGSILNTLLNAKAALNPKKTLATIENTCQNCGKAIDTFIMQKEEGIPDFSWNIVQCSNCKDYSLVSYGPNVKEVRFGNYELIEQLPKKKFTKEQAETYLNQIRHFRK